MAYKIEYALLYNFQWIKHTGNEANKQKVKIREIISDTQKYTRTAMYKKMGILHEYAKNIVYFLTIFFVYSQFLIYS